VSAATRTLAETVREAHAALHEAMGLPRRAALGRQILDLAHALDDYKALDPAAMLWEAGLPLFRDETDPDEAKLIAAAERVETAAGALIAAMSAPAAKSGTENVENAVAGVTA
jgi:hypothetical protein